MALKDFLEEAAIMKEMKHPNLVQLLGKGVLLFVCQSVCLSLSLSTTPPTHTHRVRHTHTHTHTHTLSLSLFHTHLFPSAPLPVSWLQSFQQ